ncbi:MAG TPA: class I SAM-dependent methyltransferase [candidate division Zixibacteria bacterium]|nr:class I SAM-dependent methyltransferase [candidate division Zixibacteria bacterium]
MTAATAQPGREKIARSFRQFPSRGTAARRLALCFAALLLIRASAARADYPEEIPFLPTPIEVVDRMLELAAVTQSDVVYDLGSGDGRIVIRAAKKYGARGVGIEMDAALIERAVEAARQQGVEHLVEFRREDALKADLAPASVVTLYMLPWFNEAVKPSLRKMKPGARVVAHDFGIEGWPPDRTVVLEKPERMLGGIKHPHKIFLWKIRKESSDQ